MNRGRVQLSILVVEDEMTIALMLEDMIEELGHRVSGVASRLAPALAAAENAEVDLAILDINLDGSSSSPVARVLQERGIPFVFATGYGRLGLDPAFADIPVLSKPFRLEDLRHAVDKASSDPGRSGGY